MSRGLGHPSTAYTPAVAASLPSIKAPMAAAEVQRPFHCPGWLYEEKVDGWRVLAYKDAAGVQFISRNGRAQAPNAPARWRGRGLRPPARLPSNGCAAGQRTTRPPHPCSWPSTACRRGTRTSGNGPCGCAGTCLRRSSTGQPMLLKAGSRTTASRPGPKCSSVATSVRLLDFYPLDIGDWLWKLNPGPTG